MFIDLQQSIELHRCYFFVILKEKATLKQCLYYSITYHILLFILTLILGDKILNK